MLVVLHDDDESRFSGIVARASNGPHFASPQFLRPGGNRIDEGLILASMRACSNSKRLRERFGPECGRSDIRNPNLDRTQTLRPEELSMVLPLLREFVARRGTFTQVVGIVCDCGPLLRERLRPLVLREKEKAAYLMGRGIVRLKGQGRVIMAVAAD